MPVQSVKRLTRRTSGDEPPVAGRQIAFVRRNFQLPDGRHRPRDRQAAAAGTLLWSGRAARNQRATAAAGSI